MFGWTTTLSVTGMSRMVSCKFFMQLTYAGAVSVQLYADKDKAANIKKHQKFTTLYNAECDCLKPMSRT